MRTPDPIGAALQSAVQGGVFPGAVLYVRLRGEVVSHQAFGLAARIPEPQAADLHTIYDLASLSKPLATATALLSLIQEGRLSLDTPVQEIIEEFKGAPTGAATVFHLLNHSAGLPAWRPYYELIAERDRAALGFLGSAQAEHMMLDLIRQEPLISPIGARSVYSDLGFMVLGWVVERGSGQSLDGYCRTIYDRLGAEPLGYRLEHPSPVAPTEDDPWRGRIVCGEVHDENAYAMGGVAGHAGLFGTAEAVAAVTAGWLDGYHGRPSPLRTELVRRFVTRQERTPGSSWGLGWDTPSSPSSSGAHFSAQAFGHLGFTGTSIWVDPVLELEVILLTNRVHPTRDNNAIRDFRPKLHDLIYETFVG
jgi:CubicO group peptidase (beta-lactamase class C family)